MKPFTGINWSPGYSQPVTTGRFFNMFEMQWYFRG